MVFTQFELSSLKTAKNRHNRWTAGQWQTSHITYYWEHWCSQWFDTQSGRCTGHTWDRQGNWHFVEVSGSHHTQRHSAKVPEETILAWSGIQQSITDQAINQWRDHLNALVKQKADTLSVCCDVFVHNCQFVVMLNACIALHNFVKSHSILIIFGAQIPKRICNKTVTKLSTYPYGFHYTTLWNTTFVKLFITTVMQAYFKHHDKLTVTDKLSVLMMLNPCITVVMNSLTHVVFHKIV